MSSSEELSQYESDVNNSLKPSNNKAERNGGPPAIPRDQFGYFGVHVSNLPSGIAETLLEKTFSVAGPVQVCKVVEHPNSPVYAFIKFSLLKEAQQALFKFDGYSLNGHVLAVRPAYPVSRYKRNSSLSSRQDLSDKSWERGKVINGRNKQEKNHGITYTMGSTDCRLKDGRLSDSDVVTFSGCSTKVTPLRKANAGQSLAPRFKKDSPPPRFRSRSPCKSSTPNASLESQDVQHVPVVQMAGTSSSAFRPYHGNFQEPNLQNSSPAENGVITVASSFSQLGLSLPVMKNATSYQSHANGPLSCQPGGAQGVVSWSHSGASGITTSCSNSRELSVNNQGRNVNASVAGWSPRAKPGISSWSTFDVVQHFLSTDCAEYAGFFQEQEIDGKALLLLNRETLLHFLKVGPALKVLQLIDKLRS